jgi:UDP-2-acetamido-2,6-beta-L-arabino-hexul-4-ose reductase
MRAERHEGREGGALTVRVVVTGANGFVGRNLCVALRRREDLALTELDAGDDRRSLEAALVEADVLFHLAGVNRPERVEEYASGNEGFTREILKVIEAAGRKPKIVFSSSIQAALENPYGRSKRAAEEALCRFCDATGAEGVTFRLNNLFGKWCRPNYNSVTATFCHNVANGLPIEISDPSRVIHLTYIDDVVAAFVGQLDAAQRAGFRFAEELPTHEITLGDLASALDSFRAQRATLRLPDFGSRFTRALYATYLSYLPSDEFAYALCARSDPRGSLAEFVKTPHAGQIFVSRTKPGITRGNHFHHTKAEKFLVVHGEAVIRFRQVNGSEVIEYRVRGEDYRVVDIPPGYTHSIENVGRDDLVTLFWSSEVFEPQAPDTIPEPVDGGTST